MLILLLNALLQGSIVSQLLLALIEQRVNLLLQLNLLVLARLQVLLVSLQLRLQLKNLVLLLGGEVHQLLHLSARLLRLPALLP